MKLSIKAGATSQSCNVFIQDSSSTTGAGLSGLAYNTAGLAAYYSFSGANATATAITLATLATVTTAWSSGGFIEIDATHMKGWYRLDIPDAALATSKGRSVSIHLYGATNMAPCPIEIELTGWDNQDAVHGGMSALPNTACTTNASLLTSGTGTDQVSVSSGKVLLQATQTGVTIPTVTTVTNQLTAAAIATGVWQDATSGDFTVSSSIGKSLYTSGNAPGAASGIALVGSNMGTVSSVTGAVGSVTAGVTVTTNNDKTGYSLTVTPPTAATIATTVWEDLTAGGDFGTNGSIGKLIVTTGLTVATVTNAVTLPSIPNNWITAAGIASGALVAAVWDGSISGHTTGGTFGGALNAAGSAGDPWATTIPGSYTAGQAGYIVGTNLNATITSRMATFSLPTNFAALGITAGGKISEVVLCDTLTTYTGDTPQTGDSYARIGATGSGLTSLAPAATAISTAQWTNTRAGYLDNLSAGAVALASTALSTAQWTNTRAGYLDNLSGGAVALAATALSTANWTNARAGYLDTLNALAVMKNTALNAFPFYMALASDHYSPATGLTITATRSIDGGAFAACANTASETGNGWYLIDLAASDLNGATIALSFAAATADATLITILTQP